MSYIGFSDDQGAAWTQMDVPGTVETPLRGRDELMAMVVDPASSNIVYVAAISQRGRFPTLWGRPPFTHTCFGGIPRGLVA